MTTSALLVATDDDALCLDREAEFALADAPLHTFDPAAGTGEALNEPSLDTLEGESLLLNVSQYS